MKKLLLLAFVATFALVGCKDENVDPDGGNGSLTVQNTQRSTLWYYTATWCGPCGTNGNPQYKIALNSSSRDEIVPLDLQAYQSNLNPFYKNPNDGKFYLAPFVSALNKTLRLNGYIPAFSMNNNFEGNSNVTGNALVSYAGYYNDNAPSAGIAANVKAEGQKLSINTKSKFFKAMDGEVFLSLFVLENKVVAPQLVGSTYDNNFEHHYIVRCSALGTYAAQETWRSISVGSVAANHEITGSYSFDIESYTDAPAGLTPWNFDKANTSVVAILWKKNDTDPTIYDMINSVMVGVN